MAITAIDFEEMQEPNLPTGRYRNDYWQALARGARKDWAVTFLSNDWQYMRESQIIEFLHDFPKMPTSMYGSGIN